MTIISANQEARQQLSGLEFELLGDLHGLLADVAAAALEQQIELRLEQLGLRVGVLARQHTLQPHKRTREQSNRPKNEQMKADRP